MKKYLFNIVLGLLISQTAQATVLLDDTWADGTRTDTSLPTESAWFTTSAANMAAYTDALSITNLPTGSSQWTTYYTASGSPARLAVGDSISFELSFKVTGCVLTNASQNFRVGFYDSSANARLTGDGSGPNGTNLTGYAFFGRFSQFWGSASGLEVRKRTNLVNSDILATSSDHAALGSGGSATGTPAFSNNVPYKLTVTVTRIGDTTNSLSAVYSGGGLTNAINVGDPGTTAIFTNFDTMVIRPSRGDGTATNFVFTEFKVEVSGGAPSAPSITTQPTNQGAFIGQNVSFSVGANGTAPLSHQWYFNTNTAVANATNSTLTLTSVQPSNAGIYSVVITSGSGSVTSSFVALSVFTNTSGPAIQLQVLSASVKIRFQAEAGGSYELQRSTNLPAWTTVGSTNPAASGTVEMTDNSTGPGVAPWQSYYRVKVLSSGSSSAPSITTQPTNLMVIVGQNATFNSAANGTAPLRYQWYFNTSNAVASATNAALTVNSVTTNDAGSYSVIVTNSSGAVTSAIATLTVNPTPVAPSITTQPTNLTVLAGQNATFAAAASGTAPLKYQWFFNTSTALANATNATLTISNAQGSDAGGYSVIVTNLAGAATSSVVTLTVDSPPSGNSSVIVDDTWADGTRDDTALPVESEWYASSTPSLTVAPNAMTGITGGSSSRTWWTHFTTNAASPVQLALGETLKVTVTFTPSGVNVNNTSQALRLGLYDFSNGNRTTADGASPDGSDVAGYMLGVNFGTTLDDAPLNIEKRSNLTGGNLLSSIGDYDLLSAGGGSAGAPGYSNDVPYTLEFSVTRNAASVSLTTTFANGSGWSISHTATDTNGFTDRFDGFAIRPANTTQTATNFMFTRFKVELLTSGPVAPSITTPPQDQTVTVGQNATFTVSASGTAPLSYQWYFNDTNALAGATNSVLTLNSVQITNAGGYTVIVTNSVGSATSTVASLTVNAPAAPSIATQPTNQTVTAGQTASFTVVANGSTPLSYQWYFNTNTVLANATNATLTASNAQATNIGGYSVRVTNSVGSVTSVVATLTVNAAAPSITTPPQSQTVIVSNNATFTVLAGGTAPLSYQWYFNTNTLLTGATSASLTITNIQTNNAGGYTVVVSNSVAAITSAVATLTVVSAPVGGGDLYVATDGLTGNPGTLALPTTLTKAITLVQPGGTIYLRGGTYVYSAQITLDRTNTGAGELLRKRIFAYPAEQPVLDFSSQPYGDTSSVSNPRGLQINGHWWHINGLEVKGSADNGIYVAGNSNIVEMCVTHHNRDSGLQIARYASSAAHPEWPAYNLILNCDSYDNYDSPPNGGENADGFACKLTSGPGNVFRGCVSHHNVDDGWDLFAKSETGPIDPVTIDQCVAYANGVLTDGTINANGDRNGFKLGGSSIAVNHIVTRSIAFSNLHNGFTWNSNPGEIRMVNNLAFDNTLGNYKFDVEGPIFINNLSFWKSLASDQSDRHGVSGSPATPSNCWWDKSKAQPSINSQGLIVTAADFVSLVPPAGGFTRNGDGSINLGNFGKLTESSPLIDAGDVPVLPNPDELPFEPATYYLGDPDIGAVESGP